MIPSSFCVSSQFFVAQLSRHRFSSIRTCQLLHDCVRIVLQNRTWTAMCQAKRNICFILLKSQLSCSSRITKWTLLYQWCSSYLKYRYELANCLSFVFKLSYGLILVLSNGTKQNFYSSLHITKFTRVTLEH